MPNVAISELNTAAALDGSELIPIVQTAETVRTTAQAIADLVTIPSPPSLIAVNAAQTVFGMFFITFTGTYSVLLSGTTLTLAGTGSNPAKNYTTYLTSLDCEKIVTAASPNSLASRKNAQDGMTIIRAVSGNARAGGFSLAAVFGSTTAALGDRMFTGAAEFNTDPCNGGDPSSRANILGFAVDAADVNVQFIQNDGAGGATKTDLGVSWASLSGKALRAQIEVAAGGASVDYSLTVLDTGVSYSGTVTTNLPAADTDLGINCGVNTGAGSTVRNIYVNKLIWAKNT